MADLSEHLIAITTAFVGTDVVLFGTSDGGADIVVTVVGPRENQIVRRKGRDRRHLGQSREPRVRAGAELLRGGEQRAARPDRRGPRCWRATSSGSSICASSRSTPTGLGAQRDRRLPGCPGAQQAAPEVCTARAPPPVSFIGPRLFRTTLNFPANVAPGIYQVQVFELEDGHVTDAQRSALVISKVGLEADVFDFAQQRGAALRLARDRDGGKPGLARRGDLSTGLSHG